MPPERPVRLVLEGKLARPPIFGKTPGGSSDGGHMVLTIHQPGDSPPIVAVYHAGPREVADVERWALDHPAGSRVFVAGTGLEIDPRGDRHLQLRLKSCSAYGAVQFADAEEAHA